MEFLTEAARHFVWPHEAQEYLSVFFISIKCTFILFCKMGNQGLNMSGGAYSCRFIILHELPPIAVAMVIEVLCSGLGFTLRINSMLRRVSLTVANNAQARTIISLGV